MVLLKVEDLLHKKRNLIRVLDVYTGSDGE